MPKFINLDEPDNYYNDIFLMGDQLCIVIYIPPAGHSTELVSADAPSRAAPEAGVRPKSL